MPEDDEEDTPNHQTKHEEKDRERAVAKFMRVTVDRLTEDLEIQEKQSPLEQIKLTKKAVTSVSQPAR